jgi:hypothetical protein
MKCLVSVVTLIFLSTVLIGQQEFTQTIKGNIVDKDAEYPLIGVNVVLISEESGFGTATDLQGNFKIENVPLGRQALQLSYIGYKTVTLPNILVNSGKEIFLNIQMEEELNKLDEVVISSQQDKRKSVNEMATISARSLTMEEVTRYSGSLGDVSRMAQNYAGVSGASDDRNDIIVRGNSPSSVLWRLEGVDIPSPNHWSSLGTTGGPISMLNINSMRNSDFLSGAFPAEYGNATGAVFDLNLRNGNTERFEFLGQIGFNGFEGGIEGPLSIGKNASFMANYRYSTLGVIQSLGVDFGTGAAIPQYQDLILKFNIPTEKAGRFSVWGLGGVSNITFGDDPNDNNLYSNGDGELFASADTKMIGMSHLYFFDKNTSSNLAVSYSSAQSFNTFEEIRDASMQVFDRVFTSRNTQNKLGINWTFNKKIDSQNRIKAGIIFDNYNLSVIDSVLFDDDFWFSELDFIGNASLQRAFGQWQYKANDKLILIGGIHAARFGLNESSSIEPRMSLSYQLSEKNTFGFGFGRHSQLQPLPVYFIKEREATVVQNEANEQLDLIKSNHFIVSWDHNLSSNTRFKLEAYYQSLSDLATDPTDGDFSMINFGADFGFPNRAGLTNEGTGSNIGIELTLERFLNKGFYYLVTASVFDSKYKGSDGIKRNTFFNSNYVFNVLLGKEIELNQKWTLTFDGRFNYAGGRRFTPIDLQASILADEEVRANNSIYENRYANYIRPDLKIGFRFNAKKYAQVFFIDFQNFIGRQNVFFEQYDENDQAIDTQYQRGFFPDVRYQITF